jgi:hypothetical protein
LPRRPLLFVSSVTFVQKSNHKLVFHWRAPGSALAIVKALRAAHNSKP